MAIITYDVTSGKPLVIGYVEETGVDVIHFTGFERLNQGSIYISIEGVGLIPLPLVEETTSTFSLPVDYTLTVLEGKREAFLLEKNATDTYIRKSQPFEMRVKHNGRITVLAKELQIALHDLFSPILANIDARLGIVETTKEDKTNKTDTISGEGSSTEYPSTKGVVDYTSGILTGKEDVANKTDNIASYSTSSVKYSSTKGIVDYSEALTNKVTELTETSTDAQYPSAKCVYEALQSAGKVDDVRVDGTSVVTNRIANIDGKEDTSNKVTEISSASTDTQYPSAKVTYTAVNNETTRATEVETGLRTDLTTETSNRENADTQLQTNIDNEATTRSTADTTLQNNITAETTRATTAEETLTTNLTAEVNRATAQENVIASNLSSEISRATEAEGTLQTNIDNEATTRENADTALGTRITEETTRATSEETALQTNINNEATRATNKETELATSITNETTRATAAETSLSNTKENLSNKVDVIQSGYGSDEYPTAQAVYAAIQAIPTGMIYQGTIAHDASIEATIHELPEASHEHEGWTYKAVETYIYPPMTETTTKGDLIVCGVDTEHEVHQWKVIPSFSLVKDVQVDGASVVDSTGFAHITYKFFWCTYGSTTYAEITQALNDGKTPVCIYPTNSSDDANAYQYQLFIFTRAVDNLYRFSSLYTASRQLSGLSVSSDNVWANSAISVETDSYKKSTIVGNESSETLYPNTKAVADYWTLQNKFFWCTYGTTTTTEIEEALEAGKTPVCIYQTPSNEEDEENYYPNMLLTYAYKSGTTHFFSSAWSGGTALVYVAPSNNWTRNAYSFEAPQRHRIYEKFTIGTLPINTYNLVAFDKDGLVVPMAYGNSGTTKTVSTIPFRPEHICITTTAYAAGVSAASDALNDSMYTGNGLYAFNETVPTDRDIYLVGTYDRNTGLFTLDNSSYTSYELFVPNNTTITLSDYFTAGKFYIKIGKSAGGVNAYQLEIDTPMYYFDGTNLIDPHDNKFYWCTYNVTTFEEVTQALEAGKTPVCVYPNASEDESNPYQYQLFIYSMKTSSYHKFSSLYSAGNIISELILKSDNTWSSSSTYVESTSNKSQTIDETSTVKYPSTKAVADYWTAQNKFYWVTYGTTTYAQITEAIADGKTPICIYQTPSTEEANAYENQLFTYTGLQGDCHYFSCNGYSQAHRIYVNTSNTWKTASYTMESSGNKKSTITGYETSTSYYPTTKAVADYSEALANKTTSVTVTSTDTEYPTAKAVYDAIQGIAPEASKWYWCTYGTTTYAEITTALAAGKAPVCIYQTPSEESDVYENQLFTYVRTSDGYHVFTSSFRNNAFSIWVMEGGNTWESGNLALEYTGEKSQDIATDASSTTKYPSTKAVADYAEALSNKTTTVTSTSTDTQYPSAKATYTLVNSEATARAAADTTLQTNINNEATTRGNADTTLQNNIDAEATTRGNADTTLQTNINNEATARSTADSTLQNNIDAETTRATTEEAKKENLNNKITSITSSSTDTQYPSAKAVYDYVADADKFYWCTYGTTTYAEITTAITEGKTPVCVYKTPSKNDSNVYENQLFTYTGIVGGDKHYFSCIGTLRKEYDIYVNTSNTWAAGSTSLEVASYKKSTITGYETSTSYYPNTKAVYDYAEALTNKTTTVSSTSTDTEYPSAKAVYTSVNAEATTRASADTTLQNNIDAEATTRSGADTTLQNNIDAEATRAKGVEATKENSSNKTTTVASTSTDVQYPSAKAVYTSVNAEATARSTADATLQDNIDTEAGTRSNADTTLQNNIDAEVTRATGVEATKENSSNKVTSISSSSTDVQYPSAKAVADYVSTNAVTLDGTQTITGVKTFTGATHFTGAGDSNAIHIGLNTRVNVEGTSNTVLGFMNNVFTINRDTYKLNLRGASTRPMYNGADMALLSDVTSETTRATGVEATKEDSSNKVTSITSSSTDIEYPSAKCVYDAIQEGGSGVEKTANKVTEVTSSSTDTQYPSAKATYTIVNAETTRATTAEATKEDSSNKVTSITSSSTDVQYPSAKATYTLVNSEATTRSNADTTLQNNIDAETTRATTAEGTKENSSNKVTSISSSSTDAQYPSAKCVYTQVSAKEATANKTTTVSSSSTDTQYPSAKAVYTSVDAEATARSSADTTLQNNIDAEVTRATTAEGTKENSSNKVTSITSSSTDTQYPSAKAVYTALQSVEGKVNDVKVDGTSVVTDKVANITLTGKEDNSNKVTSVSSSSTDTQYPSAKCLYDNLELKESLANRVLEVTEESTDDTYPTAKAVYEATKSGGGSYLAYSNPVGTGAMSLNRKSGTSRGSYSVAMGYNNTASAIYSTAAGGYLNVASGGSSVVSGGYSNTASATQATVSGGTANTASATQATVSGGTTNTASGECSVIGGGSTNTVSSDHSTIGGGNGNSVTTNFDITIGGGYQNTASGMASTIAGGYQNTAEGTGSAVGGGRLNSCSDITNSQYAAIAGGYSNKALGKYSAIAGGGNNTAGVNAQETVYATVGGGYQNTAGGNYSTIVGGWGNTTSGGYSTVLGGQKNTVSAHSAVVMGSNNTAQTYQQTVIGACNALDTGGSTSERGNWAFVIGNGTGTSARSNCHTVTWTGTAEYAGDVLANACGGETPISLTTLYNTVQAQQATIEALTARIAELESK